MANFSVYLNFLHFSYVIGPQGLLIHHVQFRISELFLIQQRATDLQLIQCPFCIWSKIKLYSGKTFIQLFLQMKNLKDQWGNNKQIYFHLAQMGTNRWDGGGFLFSSAYGLGKCQISGRIRSIQPDNIQANQFDLIF